MSWFMEGLGWWVTGLAAYFGFVLLLARFLSWKWHPDGGKAYGHDPETCDECRYGEERNEWYR